ncbi:MAG: glycosyltransferase family 4 protein [bacterium]
MDNPFSVLISAHIRWYNAEAEYAHRLARGLLTRGWRVIIWGLDDSPLVNRARQDGVPVITSGNPGSLNPADWRATFNYLRRVIRDGGIEVVNAMRSEGYPLVARAARRAGATVIRTRGDMRIPRLPTLNKRIYKKWTDLVISSNDLLRDELMVRLDLPADMVHTVRLGIDPEEIAPSPPSLKIQQELGLSEKDRVVGMMGRLGAVKGWEFILRGAGEILRRVPSARFLVIYRDVEKSDPFLPELAKSKFKDRFILVGPREDHREVMKAAHAAVIPSVGSEAHCRVALEWMAAGVPVVGSRVGVIPEIVEHGATGYLVQPRYSETFADCLGTLLEDPEKAESMGKKGRERLEKEFNEKRMIEETVDLYKQALRRHEAWKRSSKLRSD